MRYIQRLICLLLLVKPITSALVDFIEIDSEHQVVKRSEPLTQYGAPWNLATISHRETLGLTTFQQYIYTENGGRG